MLTICITVLLAAIVKHVLLLFRNTFELFICQLHTAFNIDISDIVETKI